jgi:multiple sugar transport system permease protein
MRAEGGGARAEGRGFAALLITLVLLLLCVPALAPTLWMLATAFKSDAQVLRGDAALLPSPVETGNFAKALAAVPFALYLRNTVALCGLNVVGAVGSSAIVAYGFARLPFRGSRTLFFLLLATMALPGQATMVPVFALFRFLGWYGTPLPLVVPSFFGAPFYIFLLVQFFRTLPEEMAESARLEGAGEWTIFCRLLLPLAKPALATCALFQFLGSWNDFMGPLLYINDPSKYTLAYGLQQFYSSYGGKWGQLMAGSVLFTLPIIVLFFFAQKTFIQGIATTGGKG